MRGVYRRVNKNSLQDSSDDESGDENNTTTQPRRRKLLLKNKCVRGKTPEANAFPKLLIPETLSSDSSSNGDYKDDDDNDSQETDDSDYLSPNNKARQTTRSTIDDDPGKVYPQSIYCDYFVVKTSSTKLLIRLPETTKISNIYNILQQGAFKRNAFNQSIIKNGNSQLNQIENEKLQRIFFDRYDNDDHIQIPKGCCLIYINNMMVYNSSFDDICDILKRNRIRTMLFQKPDIRPSRITRFKQSYNLFSKVVRHKILFRKWFEYVILLSIVANTVCLALVDPLKPSTNPTQQFIERTEYLFFGIFLLEMIFKMIGFGFYGKFYDPYLRKQAIERKQNQKKWKKSYANFKKKCKKWYNKAYTKCAEKGCCGKNRQIQVKREQLRSNSCSYTFILDDDELSFSTTASLSSFAAPSNGMDVDVNNISFVNDNPSKMNPDYFYYGYFPSGWNILDFIIVVSSFFSLFELGNMTSIRIIRILRPLRTVSKIRPLRLLISTVFSSLGKLSNVLFLMLFLFVILGIIGVQLFAGVLHLTCFDQRAVNEYMDVNGYASYEMLTIYDWYNGLYESVNTIQYVDIFDYCTKAYTSIGCKAADDAICLPIAPNPNSGLTSFDNIGFAILNEFIMITFDGWTTKMYMMQDAVSSYVWIYFFFVTFICSFFALQLNLAVLVTEYATNNKELIMKPKKKKRRKPLEKRRSMTRYPSLMGSPNSTMRENDVDDGDKSVSPFDDDMKIEEEDATKETKKVLRSRESLKMSHIDEKPKIEMISMCIDMPETEIRSRPSMPVFSPVEEENKRNNNDFDDDDIDIESLLDPSCKGTVFLESEDDDFQPGQAGQPSEISISAQILSTVNSQKNGELTEISSTSSRSCLDIKSISPSNRLALSPSSRRKIGKNKKKKKLRKFNTIGSLSELYATNTPVKLNSMESIEGWKQFKAKTFHATLKSEKLKWNDSEKIFNMDKNEVFNQPTLSSFYGMMPTMDTRDHSFSDTPRAVTPTPTKSSALQLTKSASLEKVRTFRDSLRGTSPTKMRFSIVVDHIKESEKLMKENYTLAKEAIAKARPERNVLYKDTSSIFVQKMYRICINPWFDTILLFCIIANTIVMAIQWPYMSTELKVILEWINNSFTIIFFVEMVIKMIGLGLKQYFADNFNKFDFAIVMVSIIDLVIWVFAVSIASVDSHNTAQSLSSLRSFRILKGLRLLRMFRIMRVFRVVNKIKSLRVLTATLGTAVSDVSYLCFVPFLLVFMFGTLGVSLYARDYADIDETQLSARHSFKNIHYSMITVFQVVTGDNWTGIMYENAAITGNSWSFLFFLCIVIFGDFILMNLFVAVLLTKIGDATAANNGPQQWLLQELIVYASEFNDNEHLKYHQKILQLCNVAELVRFQKQLRDLEQMWLPYYKKKIFVKKWALIGKSLGIFSAQSCIRRMLYALVHSLYFEWIIACMIFTNCVMLAYDNPTMSQREPHVAKAFRIVDFVFVCIYCLEMFGKVIADGFISKPIFDSKRWKHKNVYSDHAFTEKWTSICEEYIKTYVQGPENLMSSVGRILNCIQSEDSGYTVIHFMSADKQIKHFRMVFFEKSKNTVTTKFRFKHEDQETQTEEEDDEETPKDESAQKPVLKYIYSLVNPLNGEWQSRNYDHQSTKAPHSFCAIIHSPQMSNDRQGAYWADNWNRIDAVVVVISIVALFFPKKVGFFRVLRAIRPLRLAIRFESLRVAITSLVYSIPGVLSTLGFIALFWIALSILGVNLMCGQFMRCSITDPQILKDIITRIDCENAGGEWVNVKFNFDNIGKAMKSIFVIALRVNWSPIMWDAVDSVGLDYQPQANNKPMLAAYFIITILIAGFFSFNLLISVVVDNYQQIKTGGKALFLTEAQKKWKDQKLITNRIDITKDYVLKATNKVWCNDRLKKKIFNLVQNAHFDTFIMICIVLNTLSMCLTHYGQPAMWTKVLMILNIIFIGIFTSEAVLKISAYGLKQYWMFDHWNKFDFVLVIIALIDLGLAYVLPLFLDGGIEKYRVGFNVLRILRVGRALRLIKKADTLRMMFLTLYYSLPSLLNVGSLIFILMFIYSIIGMNLFGSLEHNGSINEFVNFESFPNAMQTLYRIGTLDSWNSIYESSVRNAMDALIAAIFFLSFCIIGTLILINVFIAVILENFVQIQALQKNNKKLDCVRIWTKTWNALDDNESKSLCVEDFLYSVVITPQPIGILSLSNLESLHEYNKEYKQSIDSLDERIADIKLLNIQKRKLQKKRLRFACRYCLHHAHHPEKLKIAFIRQVEKIKVNLVNNVFTSVDGEQIWTVSFKDVLQALSSMIVGPPINAIVTDKNKEKPLWKWMRENCDTYLDICNLDDDIELDETTVTHTTSKQPTPEQLTCLNTQIHKRNSSQYEAFIEKNGRNTM